MRFQWSISLPSRGAFHRSLAVLCAIGRHRYLALEGGPPRFPRATSFPVVLAHPSRRGAGFRLRGSHPLWQAVPGPASSPRTSPSGPRERAPDPSPNPHALIASPCCRTTNLALARVRRQRESHHSPLHVTTSVSILTRDPARVRNQNATYSAFATPGEGYQNGSQPRS